MKSTKLPPVDGGLMFKVMLVNSVFLILISSCARPSDNSSEVQIPELKTQTCAPEKKLLAAGIVGGIRVTEANKDSKNVMMLYSDGQLCTAAAISPRVLLTAAHCITGKASKSWVGLYSALSCESGFDSRYNTVEIKEFLVHPEYQKDETLPEYSKNDIALVFLKESLPSSYPIYRVALSRNVAENESLYFWGYGDISYKGGGAGILRKTKIERKDFEVLKERKKIKIDQSNGYGICQGDSGGPGLVKIDGKLQILGINSYVEGLTTENTFCSNKAYLTLVEAYLPWMRASMLFRNEFLKK